MNPAQLSIFACMDLRDLLLEREKEIMEAAQTISYEADEDAKPKLKLSFAITVDLDDNEMESVLSFSVKRSASVSHSLDDPAQPKLPGVDGTTTTVTFRDEHGKEGEPVPLTRETLSRVSRKLNQRP